MLFNEDCLAGLGRIEDGSVDLAFADPPFNIGYDYDVYKDRLASEHYLDWVRASGPAKSSASSSQTARSG